MEIINWHLKSKRNSNVFLVQTDKGEFDLHSDILVKANLKKGEVEENIFFDSVNESAILIAFNLATKYVAGKLKTEQQIKDYLYKKEFNKPTIEEVIAKLKEYKIIDDKVYAESYKNSNPNFSRNKLKHKLFSAGVKGDDMEKSLMDVDDEVSCLKNAEKFLRGKVIDKPTVDKLIRRLQSMGYNWGSIKHTLNQIKYEIEE